MHVSCHAIAALLIYFSLLLNFHFMILPARQRTFFSSPVCPPPSPSIFSPFFWCFFSFFSARKYFHGKNKFDSFATDDFFAFSPKLIFIGRKSNHFSDSKLIFSTLSCSSERARVLGSSNSFQQFSHFFPSILSDHWPIFGFCAFLRRAQKWSDDYAKSKSVLRGFQNPKSLRPAREAPN